MKVPILLVILLLCTGTGRAATITEFVNLNIQTRATGVAKGINAKVISLRLRHFDNSLGILESVRISTSNSRLLIQGQTGLNAIPSQIVNGPIIPLPYTISPSVKVRLSGFGRFDVEDINGRYTFYAPGEVIPHIHDSNFNLDFTINEMTGSGSHPMSSPVLTHWIPTSLPLYSGSLNDFLDISGTADLLLLHIEFGFTSTAGSLHSSLTTLQAQLIGRLQVDYTYTPAADSVPSVPIPPASYLLTAALIGLFSVKRRRKA